MKNIGNLTLFFLIVIFVSGSVSAMNVSINSTDIHSGDSIKITVIPGPGGVYNKIYPYNIALDCNGSFRCFTPASATLKITSDWSSGVYPIRVYDFDYRKWREFSFNVTNEAQTQELEVYLGPKSLKVGENLFINITSGTKGIYKNVYFSTLGNFSKAFEVLPTNSSKYFGVISWQFKIPLDWTPGEYYMQVYDYNAPNFYYAWKRFYFNVTL